ESLADSDGERQPQPGRSVGEERRWASYCSKTMADAHGLSEREQADQANPVSGTGRSWADLGGGGWWSVEPNVGRVADGVAFRLDRLRALGNGIVPQCMAKAWRILTGEP